MTGQSQGALASSFGALQQAANNRLARTRNSAGFGEIADDLARQKGIAQGNQAAQNQLNFSNTAYQRQMSGAARIVGIVWRGFQFVGALAGDSGGVAECAK